LNLKRLLKKIILKYMIWEIYILVNWWKKIKLTISVSASNLL